MGLCEVLEEDFLRYQVGFAKMLADLLKEHRIPVLTPPGGHAVYILMQPPCCHAFPRSTEFPGWALGCALYVEGKIR